MMTVDSWRISKEEVQITMWREETPWGLVVLLQTKYELALNMTSLPALPTRLGVTSGVNLTGKISH